MHLFRFRGGIHRKPAARKQGGRGELQKPGVIEGEARNSLGCDQKQPLRHPGRSHTR